MVSRLPRARVRFCQRENEFVTNLAVFTKVYSALRRDNCVCSDSHSGSPADPVPCNVNCPGNSSQFLSVDSWYTFHVMYLWVTPVEVICTGMPEPVGNNMPTSTTVCLDYSNEIVPFISTCPSGQHLAGHELVCDFLMRKCVLRQRCFEIKCASVSHVAHVEVQPLRQEGTENSWCAIKCIEGYTIASNTLKCEADCTGDLDWKRELHIQFVWCSFVDCEHFTHLCGTILSVFCHLQLQIWIFSKRIALLQERVLIGVQI